MDVCSTPGRTAFIESESPWENGCCERFDSKLRDETFCSAVEAKAVIESWRQCYNTMRPYSSLGCKPPAPAALSCMAAKPTLH
ncbi:integrase core domain-containing protein [Bosea sp. LjRoot9]|uniref:integrase core domain-containing protein n=1 Tax=Bosea sp. LjRoot9 TaxID=3342341 RepID=UPI003F504EA8